ncbi:50S ribosomal protein L31 [Clostridium perfringens SM101]|nr:50S ribosomal protein L31 [Clostridium perfringens SM101]
MFSNIFLFLKEVNYMRQGIHPEYHHDTVVKCACGNTFTTGSVKPELKVEICSKCHPFFTGKQKIVDVGGRVDKFNKRFNLNK